MSPNDDLVTLMVGDDLVPFTVRKELLCKNSNYFAARLSGRWAGEEKIWLSDTSTSTFKEYTNFLGSSGSPQQDIQVKLHVTPAEIDDLVQLYVLGEFVDDSALRCHAMRGIYQTLHKSPEFRWSAETVNIIFENTYEGCNLQEYVLADHLFDTSPTWLEQNAEQLSLRFLMKLVQGWAAKSQQPKLVYQHPNDAALEYWISEARLGTRRNWDGYLHEPSRRQKRSARVLEESSAVASGTSLTLACTMPLPSSSENSPTSCDANVAQVDCKSKCVPPVSDAKSVDRSPSSTASPHLLT